MFSLLALGILFSSCRHVHAYQVPMTPVDSLKNTILAKEREELDALKFGNTKLFGELLSEDAVFVDSHGPIPKATLMKHVGEFRITQYEMAQIRFVPTGERSGVLIYKLNSEGTIQWAEFHHSTFVSACWAETSAHWVCVFSQETETDKESSTKLVFRQ